LVVVVVVVVVVVLVVVKRDEDGLQAADRPATDKGARGEGRGGRWCLDY